MTKKFLIATANKGKFTEIIKELSDLDAEFLDLKEAGLFDVECEEDKPTTWENALKKAKFFAAKSGLTTIAEDTGFFIKALNGKPGIHAKRYAPSEEERIQKVLKNLEGVPREERQAYFETSICVYEPKNDSFHIFKGVANGYVSEEPKGKATVMGLDYDRIFYSPELKKNFSEVSTLQKNLVSHRGKAVIKMKLYLLNIHAYKQLLCPIGILVKNRKVFLAKRRDQREEFNNKWEFPGGGIDNGEGVEECLLREVLEETGYKIKIIEPLPTIATNERKDIKFNCQIFLLSFICKIIGGEYNPSDAESDEGGWFSLKEVLKMELLPLNKKSIQDKNNLKILKKYVD